MTIEKFSEHQWSKFNTVKICGLWFRIQGVDFENNMVCLENDGNDWVPCEEIQKVSKWFMYFLTGK